MVSTLTQWRLQPRLSIAAEMRTHMQVLMRQTLSSNELVWEKR